MSVETHFGPDRARITLAGPLDQAALLQLRRVFSSSINYYRYGVVELELQSPGGDAQAIKALVSEMQSLRNAACAVATTALMEAASAAAVALAMGDVGLRVAQPYSVLLFHDARISLSAEHAMTATDANAAARQLESLNQAIIDMLIQHIICARGGVNQMAHAGLTRCQTLQLQAERVVLELGADAGISGQLGTKGCKGNPSENWFKVLKEVYAGMLRKSDEALMGKFLTKLFAMDQRMPVELAWALQLIDHVSTSSVMVPETKIDCAPSSNAPNMRLTA